MPGRSLPCRYCVSSRSYFTVWHRRVSCTSVQQSLKMTWLSEIALSQRYTEPSLFEHICFLSDFQNKCSSNCTDCRCGGFCVLSSAKSRGGLNPSLKRALSWLMVSSTADFSEQQHRWECASPFPWAVSHAHGREMRHCGRYLLSDCTKISWWLRPVKLHAPAVPSERCIHLPEPLYTANRPLALWRNDEFTWKWV